MKIRIITVAGALLLAGAPASYALQCSIHPAKGTPEANLPQLAKISKEQAEETALKAVKSSKEPGISEGELEVEQSCLIYSFDIQIPGKSGVQEVMVDAGTGKVLSQTHESALHESAEHAADQRAAKHSGRHGQ